MQHSDSAGWADVDRNADRFTTMLANRTGQFEAVGRLLVDMLDLALGLRVIDVGCGNGDHACALAEKIGPGGGVVGIDRSEAMIESARERSRDLSLPPSFVVGEAEKLPYESGTFDRARASLLMLHVEDPAAVLGEMVRVTKSGGLVLAAENDLGASTMTGSDRALTRRVLDFICDNIRNGWIGRQLPGLFVEAGLRDIEVQPFTIVMRELSLWERINGALEPLLQQGVDRGMLLPDEVSRWIDDVRAIDAAGKFLSSFTAFAVRGRKS